MTSPITAIIPTFNRASLLPRAIDSVLKQTRPPSQIIVVDDGSSDDTGKVCQAYAGRVEYAWQENSGASASRNLGVRLARNAWVAFLDSDDYWTPLHLERMMTAIEGTAHAADLYFADMQMPDAEGGGTLWELGGFLPKPPFQLVLDATAWVLMRRQPTMLQSSVIRKRALDRIGGLDVRFRLIHDTYAFCQLGIGGPACAVTGIGSIQTADDNSPVRLTTDIPLGSDGHVAESCQAWLDILRKQSALPAEFERLVRCNAAGFRWGFGKNLMRSGNYARGTANLAKALALDPGFAFWLLRHRTRNGFESTVRPACAEVISRDRSAPVPEVAAR